MMVSTADPIDIDMSRALEFSIQQILFILAVSSFFSTFQSFWLPRDSPLSHPWSLYGEPTLDLALPTPRLQPTFANGLLLCS